MMELLLTVEQAAERLQVRPNTVRQHLSRGLLRGVKRGRQWRIPVSALTEKAPAKQVKNPLARALAVVEERDARSKSEGEGPFARALALVAQLEKEMAGAPPRTLGVDDAATEIRAVREAQTP